MAAKRMNAKDRSAQIANAAASLFAKHGFNGVTTREIAKKARVNEAMIFRHFPTKEALYTEIIDQKVHFKPEIFDLEAAAKKGDAEVLASVARFLIEEVEKDGTFMRLMLFSALEGHGLSHLFVRNRINVLFDFLSNYISKGMAGGNFKKADPVLVTRAFIGMIFHFTMAFELFNVPKSMYVSKEDAIKGFVDLYLNGLRRNDK